MSPTQPIGIRWTVGDVSPRGFEALRLSIWGAWGLFGPEAEYIVCVNTIPLAEARRRTGEIPGRVGWRDTDHALPASLAALLDAGLAEGAGWKLAPLRCFPGRHEISLDNDCILWDMPAGMDRWLRGEKPGQCLMAEDVRACFGRFAELCGPEARNAGIRGLPPGFDFEAALHEVLSMQEAREGARLRMSSELDEQGLQTAALSRFGPPLAVSLDDVTICSPFYPHLPDLGRCGAHFVGLNARHIAWDYYDRPADEWMTDHWNRHRGTLYEKVRANVETPA